MRSLFLAWRYMAAHRGKTAILVACIALTAYLPLTVHLLLQEFEQDWTQRASATPLVAGAKGSRFDLTLHALYFQTQPPETILMGDVENLRSQRLGTVIPLNARYSTQNIPVVGTTLAYFDFRNLSVREGESLALLGDCVVGYIASRELGLTPGDGILTDPENVFDVAGTQPLRLRVAGILDESGTADDNAVFVDIKTAWVIAGIGHGHADMKTEASDDVVLNRENNRIVANAALENHIEITPENVTSFHFHGEREEMPVTAAIVVPPDDKSAVLLRGRYQSRDSPLQLLVPGDVVDEMLRLLLRARAVLDANVILVAGSTILFLILVIALSLKLRGSELEIMFHLGCARLTAARLVTLELAAVLITGLLLALALGAATVQLAPLLLKALTQT